MSSLAYPRQAAPDRTRRRDLVAVVAGWGSDVLLGVAVTLLAVVLLGEIAGDFNVDSWLALVTGREVWQGGIPHHEALTAMSLGATWIDQQWLSQLADYGLYVAGGLGLLGLVNVALLIGPVAAATAAARRFGAPFRSVLLVLPVCLAMVTPSREVRTQEFAIPLFMALVYLLAGDSRRSSRRVYWCLPILVLWANLHGTVTLGAMLVALRGATVAWERREQLTRSARAWLRPLALIIGAPLATLVTPYGLSIVGYYHSTLLSGTLRHSVVEWQPVTVVPTTAVALLIIAAVAIWSFGRNPARTTTWEKLALLALAAGSISVVRNALFFGLFALMIVPVSVAFGPASSTPATPDRRRGMVNGALALTSVAALALTAAVTLSRPDSQIELTAQRPRLLAAVQQVTGADPSLRVLADEHFADWLLWRDPALSGRIANDVRFELLSAGQIAGLESVFSVIGPNWKQGARGYRVLVLDRSADAAGVTAFLREPGRRVLYDDGRQIVILRGAHEAARA